MFRDDSLSASSPVRSDGNCSSAMSVLRSASVQVALPNGDQLVVPEWMLDEERCQGMEITMQPVVALSALQALRVLLDAQIPRFWTVWNGSFRSIFARRCMP